MAESDAAAPAKAKPAALRKGALVKVNRAAYSASLEAGASDPSAPDYTFEGPGELLVVKGDYGQVRWNRRSQSPKHSPAPSVALHRPRSLSPTERSFPAGWFQAAAGGSESNASRQSVPPPG